MLFSLVCLYRPRGSEFFWNIYTGSLGRSSGTTRKRTVRSVPFTNQVPSREDLHLEARVKSEIPVQLRFDLGDVHGRSLRGSCRSSTAKSVCPNLIMPPGFNSDIKFDHSPCRETQQERRQRRKRPRRAARGQQILSTLPPSTAVRPVLVCMLYAPLTAPLELPVPIKNGRFMSVHRCSELPGASMGVIPPCAAQFPDASVVDPSDVPGKFWIPLARRIAR